LHVHPRTAVLLALAALSGSVRAVQPAAPPRAPDRSRELLDYRCSSDIGTRQVTLFANGTVRVREGLGKSPRMTLGELGPDELTAFINRLGAEDLSEVQDTLGSAEGSWVERCTLRLALDDRPARELHFARYDSLPLAIADLVRITDDMAGHAHALDELPLQYHPQPGDVLRRTDGVLFEVVGFTSDKQGVELQGVEQPLVLYLQSDQLHGLFLELVSRRP